MPIRFPQLTLWAGAKGTPFIEQLNAKQKVAQSIEWLSKVLKIPKSLINRELSEGIYHSWGDDPYCRGAYSYIKVGGMPSLKYFRKGIENTLYFAGEAFNPEGQTGTIDGALESAKEVANKLL